MKHLTTAKFWKHFKQLPNQIQSLAHKNFKLLKENPQHPSLHFKQIESYWSVRVGLKYRALGFTSLVLDRLS